MKLLCELKNSLLCIKPTSTEGKSWVRSGALWDCPKIDTCRKRVLNKQKMLKQGLELSIRT